MSNISSSLRTFIHTAFSTGNTFSDNSYICYFREEEFLKKQNKFRSYAFLIIKEMVDMASKKHPSKLVDEVLHSIFCLGKITNPEFSPQCILDDNAMLNELKGRYPRPFALFSSQLPKRSPFSCVLDMIVNLKGQEKENEIGKELRELIQRLKTKERTALKEDGGTALISSTICVSQRNAAADSVRYYGVSMSTSGRDPGRIIVAASCLSNWDSYVADAVVTYYPLKTKKSDFDGTIKLPEQVRCQAFSLSDGTPMAPCRSCGNLFGLTTSDKQEWAYGNCAEAESLSNLLKNETKMRERVQQPSNTAANRQKAVNSVRTELSSCLGRASFQWDNHYYTPQGN
ncbi:uncharacterized protein [Pagrus major]|uniref:uncharacterized protein n=1 Tax=Pagrus major TaxID=143350 RepID=UPI003CC8AC90